MPSTPIIVSASPELELVAALQKESACRRNWRIVGPVNLREPGQLELASCSADVILIEAEDFKWLLDTRPKIMEATLVSVQTIMITSDDQLLDAVTLQTPPHGFLIRENSGKITVGHLVLARDGYLAFTDHLLNQLIGNCQRLEIVAMFEAEERRILSYIGRGLNNQKIAENTGLSESRVKTLVYILTHKLRMRNRTEVAVFALTNSLSCVSADQGCMSPKGHTQKSDY